MSTKTCIILTVVTAVIVILAVASCEHATETNSSSVSSISQYEYLPDGSEYLLAALEELESIANISATSGVLSRSMVSSSSLQRTLLPMSATADTTITFGTVTVDGYGATISEKITHPKGILLITISKSYGKVNGHTVTDVRKYSTYDDYANGVAQSTTITEVYGLSKDTIVTHVTKDNTSETYTFKLPVITRTVDAQDGSVSVSSRYALDGMVITEVKDGTTNIVSQLKKSYGLSDGSLISRIEYPTDNTWKQTRTLGRSDGSILKEVTSNY